MQPGRRRFDLFILGCRRRASPHACSGLIIACSSRSLSTFPVLLLRPPQSTAPEQYPSSSPPSFASKLAHTIPAVHRATTTNPQGRGLQRPLAPSTAAHPFAAAPLSLKPFFYLLFADARQRKILTLLSIATISPSTPPPRPAIPPSSGRSPGTLPSKKITTWWINTLADATVHDLARRSPRLL